MNIFQEISTILKIKRTVQDIIKETEMPTNSVKPGWKTTEFWFNIAAQAATLFGAVKGFIPANIASIVSIAGVAVYTVARTIIKAAADLKAARTGTVVAA